MKAFSSSAMTLLPNWRAPIVPLPLGGGKRLRSGPERLVDAHGRHPSHLDRREDDAPGGAAHGAVLGGVAEQDRERAPLVGDHDLARRERPVLAERLAVAGQ